jgi:hypothetical protein
MPPEYGQYLDDLNSEDNSVSAQLFAGSAHDIEKAVDTAQTAFQSFSHSLGRLLLLAMRQPGRLLCTCDLNRSLK